jgi:hypothetical protein
MSEKFQCDLCPREFKTKNSLDKHKRLVVHKISKDEQLSLIPISERKILIKVGKHFLDPNDIVGIKEAKKGLYIVKLRSEPNPEWPVWVEEKDIESVLKYFSITE